MELKNCTAAERILLHLLDFLKNDCVIEVPIEITQEGISSITCIQRKHLPRSLRKLIEKGLIIEKQSHVTGKKQIMKTYLLTSEGRKEAIRIKNIVTDQNIPCLFANKKKNYTISEIYKLFEKKYSYSCIISQVVKHDIFSEHNLNKKKSNQNEEISAEKIYKEALEEAWKDGILTIDERNILKKLRDTLHISKQVHNRIQQQILLSKNIKSNVYKKVYDIVLQEVLTDNKISKDEEAILIKLQKYFNIDDSN